MRRRKEATSVMNALDGLDIAWKVQGTDGA